MGKRFRRKGGGSMKKYVIEFQDKEGNELFSKIHLFANIKAAKFWANEFVQTTSIKNLHKSKTQRFYEK